MNHSLIQKNVKGILCSSGEFYIDPWGQVPIALITHAHGDHARFGSETYYCTEKCAPLLATRLGGAVKIISKPYGEKFKLGKVWVSFHPAGHILGSSQIRMEEGSHVTVISGDYKRDFDPTCEPWEVVQCNEFVTESTFGLPIYQWPKPEEVMQEIQAWWQENLRQGYASVLFCYALGKAQRVLAMLPRDEPMLVHGAIASLNEQYEKQNVFLGAWKRVSEADPATFKESLILAPPSAAGSLWMKKFAPFKTAACSGWMHVRGSRRRKGYDTGFVLSDHADWPALLRTVQETKAQKIWVTHGYEEPFARYLTDHTALANPFPILEWTEEEED